jgi:putative ABC transport system permease protein
VHSTTGISWEGKHPEDRVLFTRFVVDYDYFETLDLEMVQGRSFSREFSTDPTEGYVLNETAARLTGYEDPIGKTFSLWNRPGKIIGIVEDYHFKSLHTAIEPLVHYMWGSNSYAFIRLRTEGTAGTLQTIENVYKKFNPGYPFDFFFLDEELNRLYISDKRTGKVFQSFMFLALFISCLGLFGLASYMADLRTKEIGIRKILGASASGIFLLLLKEFVKWVLVANAVAWPLAYLVMLSWLKTFAYRTDMAIWIFAASGICGLIVAALTVSYQSLKASVSNPVNALRYE